VGGAAYLAWLGLRMPRSRGGSLSAPQGESGTGGYSARSVLLKSFLVAVTNPKGYLFCSALLPQFIDPAAAQAPQYIAIALVFALIDFLVMLAYAFAGSRAARCCAGGRTVAGPPVRRHVAGAGRLPWPSTAAPRTSRLPLPRRSPRTVRACGPRRHGGQQHQQGQADDDEADKRPVGNGAAQQSSQWPHSRPSPEDHGNGAAEGVVLDHS
jgi:hypothetical protein